MRIIVARTMAEYEAAIKLQPKQKIKRKYWEHFHGSTRTLYLDGRPMLRTPKISDFNFGNLSERKFNSFLGTVKKNIYQQFDKNQNLYLIDIKYKNPTVGKNTVVWDSMKDGTHFYCLDMQSAYWQILYKLGYISEKLFIRYFENDDYKQAKRYCVTFLNRKNKMIYRCKGEKEYTIVCDIGAFEQIYSNVRYELSNIVHNALATTDRWVEYNTDGIYVAQQHLQKIKDSFKAQGVSYFTTLCIKKNEYEYYQALKEGGFRTKWFKGLPYLEDECEDDIDY